LTRLKVLNVVSGTVATQTPIIIILLFVNLAIFTIKQRWRPADAPGQTVTASSPKGEEFLDWYNRALSAGAVEDVPVEWLPVYMNREPRWSGFSVLRGQHSLYSYAAGLRRGKILGILLLEGG
jgi:hypothetical protein